MKVSKGFSERERLVLVVWIVVKCWMVVNGGSTSLLPDLLLFFLHRVEGVCLKPKIAREDSSQVFKKLKSNSHMKLLDEAACTAVLSVSMIKISQTY